MSGGNRGGASWRRPEVKVGSSLRGGMHSTRIPGAAAETDEADAKLEMLVARERQARMALSFGAHLPAIRWDRVGYSGLVSGVHPCATTMSLAWRSHVCSLVSFDYGSPDPTIISGRRGMRCFLSQDGSPLSQDAAAAMIRLARESGPGSDGAVCSAQPATRGSAGRVDLSGCRAGGAGGLFFSCYYSPRSLVYSTARELSSPHLPGGPACPESHDAAARGVAGGGQASGQRVGDGILGALARSVWAADKGIACRARYGCVLGEGLEITVGSMPGGYDPYDLLSLSLPMDASAATKTLWRFVCRGLGALALLYRAECFAAASAGDVAWSYRLPHM